MSDTGTGPVQNRVKKLWDETDFNSTLFESLVGYAVIAADFDGTIIAYNEGARHIYGYAPDEVCGRHTIDVFFPRDFIEAGYFQQAIDVLLATGRFSYEGEKVRNNGERFPAHILFTLTKDKTGKVVGFVEIVQDLTERRQAEEDLRRAKEAAEAANRAKSDFLANMSHEIRTPMNGIIGMTELALNTTLTDEQSEYLSLVKHSADSLLRLLNDILDFSKIEAGKLELEAVDFSLREQLGDTVHTLGLRTGEKGLELACRIPPNVPDNLVGDPGRLSQIITNLVGNAIKFTEKGEVVVDVQAEERRGPEVVLHFAVRDMGIGIPPDKQKLLFQAFSQADTSITRRFGGTGLGLAISSRLVAQMGGKIWVESAEGKGSTFHFTARFGLGQGPPARPFTINPALVRGLRVLVVDDNATNRFILEETLASWQMQPTAVDGGRAALAVLERARQAGQPFSLVLLDGLMPEMDGFELAEKIKQDPRLAGSTVMMLTSSGHVGDAERCRQLGLAAYLTKPVKQADLWKALLTAVGTAAAPSPAKAGAGLCPENANGRRLQVLLAEDNPINQKLAVRLLERAGHAVVVAGDGREALAALERQPFDVVLMDVQMPELNGWEATAQVRAKEKRTGAHIPIIAMTAYALKGDRELCLQAGMDGYLTKPIEPRALYATLDRFATIAAPPAAQNLGTMHGDEALDRAVGLDRALALDRVGGDRELLADLLRVFLETSPQWLGDLSHAVAGGDAARIHRLAHTLKGSLGMFGAGAACAAAQTLETMGRTGALAGVVEARTDLEQEMDRLAPKLAAWLKELSA